MIKDLVTVGLNNSRNRHHYDLYRSTHKEQYAKTPGKTGNTTR